MATATSEDTEITLGTGKLLALFFGLVTLCAMFFALGFSFGKNSVLKLSASDATAPAATTTATFRPSAVKTAGSAPSPAAPASAADTGTKNPADQPAPSAAGQDTGASQPAANTGSAPADPVGTPPLNGYYVQVAAVSKQEDADALVDALKKKQYPAFSANAAPDKLFHVQVGPYADVKDAELMRAKLVGDGYNPILKK
jgi:DedD protein